MSPLLLGHRRPLHHSPELPHQRRHLSLAQHPPAALPALTGTKCWAGQQKSSMGIPAAHIPTLQLSPRSRQRLTRSQKRLWQGLLAPAHLRGPGEPQRGRPATHRPQRHQRRGHPAGRNRRVVELMRLGPGTTWDTPWPQWTHVISVQFLCGNKIQRLETTTKKCVRGGCCFPILEALSPFSYSHATAGTAAFLAGTPRASERGRANFCTWGGTSQPSYSWG